MRHSASRSLSAASPPPPPRPTPAASNLVISEVYGAGGNNGATFNADFVELYNPTGSAISLAGKGLQYRSSGGGSGGVAALTGSVPANSTFLIRVAAPGANGAALPTPDLVTSTTLNMSGTAGQVLSCPTRPRSAARATSPETPA